MPPGPDLLQQMEELLSSLRDDDACAFERVCWCLLGGSPLSQSRNDELLPRWANLPPDIQSRILEVAAAYLNGACPITDLSWIGTHQLPYRVMYGFWALRLLSVSAPAAFSSISPDSWWDWMPCVFGDPYSDSVVDERHEVVLRAAHRFARNRFLELFRSLIEGQNETWGAVYILDRILPVWDDEIAELLRGFLLVESVKFRSFQKIFDVLIQRRDESAVQIATDLVMGITAGPQ